MKIGNFDGKILVGNYNENTIGNADISLYPTNMSGTSRISFNSRYPAYQSDLDVFVGRYPERTDGRESPRLHLHGASGIEMTYNGGSIMQYDADTYGDQIYFSSDVIGNFYSLSDSRFKDNVTPLTNTLSGLEQLTGVSFRLNAAPSDSTRNRMINIKNDNRTRFGFLAQEVKEATSTNITFANASPNSIVTVYKNNAIPYVAPLYLQNDTLDASQYFQVNDIHIGKAVDTNRTEGNVVIESGTLTFESNGDVWIGDGLIIKEGATLIIKNTGKAILSGGLVEGSGTLRIEAGEEIEIQPGFEAKAGANVEFK